MKKDCTELVFILDKSGSMHSLTLDTIGGFNSMIDNQKKETGECLVTTVLFNDTSSTIHDRIPVNDVKELTTNDYQASGCTALIDALGDAIQKIENIHHYIRPEDVPERTLFVITTDGMENASHKFSDKEVKDLIKKHQEEGWEFMFMAANIDAVETAKGYGIKCENAYQYYSTVEGTKDLYSNINACVINYRRGEDLNVNNTKPKKDTKPEKKAETKKVTKSNKSSSSSQDNK